MIVNFKEANMIVKSLDAAIKANNKSDFIEYIKNSCDNSKYFTGHITLYNKYFSLLEYGIKFFNLGA